MGTHDPYGRQYRPPLGGGREVGDVGSGEEFGGDIYRLYLSGRVFIPETANLYSTNTNAVQNLGATVEGFVDADPAFAKLNRMVFTMHRALHRTTTSLHTTALTLVDIVDDYVRTDEAARDEFIERYKDDLKLDGGENSPPPLASGQQPETYAAPPSPTTYGDLPEAVGPGDFRGRH